MIAQGLGCVILKLMKKLILIDDHKMLRKGISAFFTENSDWTILAEAESIEEISSFLKKNPLTQEDTIIAIVDIQLKTTAESGINGGFDVVKLLTSHHIPSVVFSSHDTGSCIERAMSAEVGAKGFVSKLSDEKMFLDAVNTVAQGKTFVQPDLVSALLENRSLFMTLTKREQQVVNLISDGFTNEEIADRLEIKLSTLENYISVIYDKLGCRDRTALLEKLR